MTPLQEFLFEAKSAGLHCADPAFRRAGARASRFVSSMTVASKPSIMTMLQSLAGLLQALPLLDDPDAIQKTGSAIACIVDSIRAESPKPQAKPAAAKVAGGVKRPVEGCEQRFYWQEKRDAG